MKEDLVDMEDVGGVPLTVAVVKGEHLICFDFEAGFFPDFAFDRFAGRVIDISPAAGQGPAAVGQLLDQEDLVLAKDNAAYIDLGGGVAGLSGKQGLTWAFARSL